MLSDCNRVNQAQLKQPWSFYIVHHTITPAVCGLHVREGVQHLDLYLIPNM